MAADYISELMTGVFGKEWSFDNATLSLTFLKPVHSGDTITTNGSLASEVAEGAVVRKTYDVWAQNQSGEIVVTGTAGSLVMPAIRGLLEQVFGAGDRAGRTRVDGDGGTEAAGEAFEGGLGDVVVVVAGDAGVQVHAAFLRHRFEEVRDVLGWQLADEVADEGQLDCGVGPATEVDDDLCERFVHGDGGVGEAGDAAAVAERFVERLAEDEADIFEQVVGVAVDVAFRLDGEVEEGVAGERLQQVIEHADAGGDLVLAAAVEVEGERDVGLFGLAGDLGAALTCQRCRQSPASLRRRGRYRARCRC